MFLSSFPQHKGDSYKTTHQAERLTSGPKPCALTPAVQQQYLQSPRQGPLRINPRRLHTLLRNAI